MTLASENTYKDLQNFSIKQVWQSLVEETLCIFLSPLLWIKSISTQTLLKVADV